VGGRVGVGFLPEALDLAVAVALGAGLDVAVLGGRARRFDAEGDEPTGAGGDVERAVGDGREALADVVVAREREHRRAGVALAHCGGGVGQRRARVLRLGLDQHPVSEVYRPVGVALDCEDVDVVGARAAAVDRPLDQGALAAEREELLRAGRRRRRVEPRADAAGEHDGDAVAFALAPVSALGFDRTAPVSGRHHVSTRPSRTSS